MAVNTIRGDLVVTGNLAAGSQTLSAGSVANSQVASNAGIETTKLYHLHKILKGDPGGTTATAKIFPMFIASGSATINEVNFSVYTAPTGGGTETITCDLKKNGSTVLASTVSFTDSDSDRDVKDGTLNTTSLVADDWVEFVVTVSGSGGTQGLGIACSVTITEADHT